MFNLDKIPSISDESRMIFLREGTKPPKFLPRKKIEHYLELKTELEERRSRGGYYTLMGFLRSLLHVVLIGALVWSIVFFASVHPPTGIALGVCGSLLVFGYGLYSTNRYYQSFGADEPKIGVWKIPLYLFGAAVFPVMETGKRIAYLEKKVAKEGKEIEVSLSESEAFFKKEGSFLEKVLKEMIEKVESTLEDASHLANRNEVREEELEAVLDSYREAFNELKKGNSFWNPPL